MTRAKSLDVACARFATMIDLIENIDRRPPQLPGLVMYGPDAVPNRLQALLDAAELDTWPKHAQVALGRAILANAPAGVFAELCRLVKSELDDVSFTDKHGRFPTESALVSADTSQRGCTPVLQPTAARTSDPRIEYVRSVAHRLLFGDPLHRDGHGVAMIIERMAGERLAGAKNGWRDEDIITVVNTMLALVPESWLDGVVRRAADMAISYAACFDDESACVRDAASEAA